MRRARGSNVAVGLAKANLAHILSVADRKFEDVPVPEWGCTVRIAVMSGIGRAEYDRNMVLGEGIENFIAKVVVATAIHDDGTPIFTLDHVEQLKLKSFDVLSRLASRGVVLNGLTKAAADEIAKNSVAGQNSASGIDSPATLE